MSRAAIPAAIRAAMPPAIVPAILAAILGFGALAAIAPSPAHAEPLPRAAHIARALAALRALGAGGRDQLDRALYTAARERCRSADATPAAHCLITAARAACAGDPDRPRCEAAADVIATNLRGSTTLVDEPTRMQLVRTSTDYRVALAAELRRRYATLAAELALHGGATGDPGAEAASIDELCLHRDREVHVCLPGDRACVPSLPWSRCVAALVWFLAGTP